MRPRRHLPLLFTSAVALAGGLVAWLQPRAASSLVSTPPVLPAEGALAWDVRDADTGDKIPCKLSFVGVAGTPTPAFTRIDIGRHEGDAVLAYNRIMSLDGDGVARVPFGTYDIYISRGPEWDMQLNRKVAIGPRGVQLVARLHHVVDTTGWVSADFHVHASRSPDSHVPMYDRIYEFVSDGVDVITSTDHNVIADYAPIISELGVGRHITSMVGDEMTTGAWGHFGAFPLPQDLERAGQGAVLVHGRSARDFFADVRKDAPGAIIDVHHPRIDREIGYFNLAGLDSWNDRVGKPGFSWDFDAVEVLNGYQDSERRNIDRVVEDWYHLLDHGHVVTATGNSDTHHLDMNIGGYPRNYVRVSDDHPAAVRPVDIARGLRAHNSFFTTAPFVQLHVDGAGIGGLATVKGGKFVAEVEVRAAPWVSVNNVILVQDGVEMKRWTVAPNAPTGPGGVRFRDSIELPAKRDGWIVARVEGSQPLAPIVGDLRHFDVRPFALTNPVLLDFDGNGEYDAPMKCAGHEGPSPGTSGGPLRHPSAQPGPPHRK